jgi:hypothetical protein
MRIPSNDASASHIPRPTRPGCAIEILLALPAILIACLSSLLFLFPGRRHRRRGIASTYNAQDYAASDSCVHFVNGHFHLGYSPPEHAHPWHHLPEHL